MNQEWYIIFVQLLLISLPICLALCIHSVIWRIPFLRKVRDRVDELDASEVAFASLTYFEAVRDVATNGDTPEEKVKRLKRIKADIRTLREFNSVGKRIAAAEHIMPMWRDFADNIQDTCGYGLLFLAVVLVYLIMENTRGVTVITEQFLLAQARNLVSQLTLPTFELFFTVFSFRAYFMLKKHTAFYERELNLSRK
jgi:hypothetical protein